jgi:methionine-rich copper-binding protein CopC
MRGIGVWGDPYVYDGDTLPFRFSGDPVTGTGDLNLLSGDATYILGSTGPFTMNPGDSQYVLLKFAVGFGDNNLSSITRMKEILNLPFVYPTAVEQTLNADLPRTFRLGQNYPNPFNPTTAIEFSVPERADVKLDIYNILGRKVKTLVDREMTAGDYTVQWDGTNQSGHSVATGVYLYRLTAGDHSASRKMLLLK